MLLLIQDMMLIVPDSAYMLTTRGNWKSSSSLSTGGRVSFTRALRDSCSSEWWRRLTIRHKKQEEEGEEEEEEKEDNECKDKDKEN